MIDKSEARVRQMFGEIAGRYDFLNHLLSANVDRYWRWRTIRAVPPAEGPILDLCTGTGDLALAYYRASGGRAKIVAADFCHPMLLLGDKKRQHAGCNGQLTFVEADAQRLPFPDDHFSIVCVAFGLRNVTDTDRGLREMARVCRPGGRVAVLEFSLPKWRPLRAIYLAYFRHVLPRIGQALARNRHAAYSYLPDTVSEFPSGDALAGRMQKAGLAEVAFRSLTLGVATLYVGTK
ncbi:MAG TPA: bifunctional demethylmenaquinone methyltransferase/2-methoxy-6-polyprenyl-1,4-benzoquinol methylase UbiE [Pirellulales bacterium]|nr:bifunctional demethylmenaquinone methyltransferase/2-methoxy-6-polyprenyl-1,4-benzoquinol methylase UbiE [Pirellulales bacterium]